MLRSLKVIPGWIKRVNLALSKYEFSSQKALAEDLGITPRRASDFFNGRSVDSETFIAICQRLDLDWQKVAKVSPEMLKTAPAETTTSNAPTEEPPNPAPAIATKTAKSEPKKSEGIPRLASSLFRPVDTAIAQKKVLKVETPEEPVEEEINIDPVESVVESEPVIQEPAETIDPIPLLEVLTEPAPIAIPVLPKEPEPIILKAEDTAAEIIQPELVTEMIEQPVPEPVTLLEVPPVIVVNKPVADDMVIPLLEIIAPVEEIMVVSQVQSISSQIPEILEIKPSPNLEDPLPIALVSSPASVAPAIAPIENASVSQQLPDISKAKTKNTTQITSPPVESDEPAIAEKPVAIKPPEIKRIVSQEPPPAIAEIPRAEEPRSSSSEDDALMRLAAILTQGLETIPEPPVAVESQIAIKPTVEPVEPTEIEEPTEDLSQVLQQIEDFQAILRIYYDACDLEDWDTAALALVKIDWNYVRSANEVSLVLNLLKRLLHHRWLDGYRHLSDLTVHAQILFNAGIACFYLENYSDAISYYEGTKAIAEQLPDLKLQIQAVRELGQIYQVLGQYQTAIKYNQEYLILAQTEPELQAVGLSNLGNIYYSLRQYRTAIKYYLELLDLPDQWRSMDIEFSAVGNLGNCYYNLSDFQAAISYQQRYLEFTQVIKNSEKEATSLLSLGFAYYSLGLYQTAIENLQRVLEIAIELTDNRLKMSAFSGLGLSYQALNSYQTAAVCFHKCLQLTRVVGDRTAEVRAMSNLRKVNIYLNT